MLAGGSRQFLPLYNVKGVNLKHHHRRCVITSTTVPTFDLCWPKTTVSQKSSLQPSCLFWKSQKKSSVPTTSLNTYAHAQPQHLAARSGASTLSHGTLHEPLKIALGFGTKYQWKLEIWKCEFLMSLASVTTSDLIAMTSINNFLATFVCLLSLASTLFVPPFNSINIFSDNSANHTSHDVDPILNDTFNCIPRLYGRDLNQESCRNAWNKIKQTNTPRTFNSRPPGRGPYVQIPIKSRLPIRYLSDDGLYAIDFRMQSSSKRDTSNTRAIAAAADLILRNCVERVGYGGNSPVACESINLLRPINGSSMHEISGCSHSDFHHQFHPKKLGELWIRYLSLL